MARNPKNVNGHIRTALRLIAQSKSGFMSYSDLKELIEKHKPKESRLRAENISNHTLGHCLRCVDNAEKIYINYMDNGYFVKVLMVRFT